MKRLLIVAAAAVSVLVSTMAPAQALQKVENTKTNLGDCPVATIAAYIQKPRLISSQPLNLGFGIEVGQHKAPVVACATKHTIRAVAYLYALPIGGPRSLVSTTGTVGFCTQCDKVFAVTSNLTPPGIYQVIGDVFLEDVGLDFAIAGTTFFYDGLEITPL